MRTALGERGEEESGERQGRGASRAASPVAAAPALALARRVAVSACEDRWRGMPLLTGCWCRCWPRLTSAGFDSSGGGWAEGAGGRTATGAAAAAAGEGARGGARSKMRRTSRSCSSFFCKVLSWPRSVALRFMRGGRVERDAGKGGKDRVCRRDAEVGLFHALFPIFP